MTSGHRAISLVAVWVSVGGAVAATVSTSFLSFTGAETLALVSILAAAAVAGTWLILRPR